MTASQFEVAALEIYQNYWRIRATIALYGRIQIATEMRLDYANVPAVGFATLPTVSESVEDAIVAMNDFIARRLRRDLLLALIAEFESRLVAKIGSLGLSCDGTLGKLQNRLQGGMVISSDLAEDLGEVRERRNAMMHHGDLASARYVSAAALVRGRAGRYVATASVGDNVVPSDEYLAYAVDVLVRYSNAMG